MPIDMKQMIAAKFAELLKHKRIEKITAKRSTALPDNLSKRTVLNRSDGCTGRAFARGVSVFHTVWIPTSSNTSSKERTVSTPVS